MATVARVATGASVTVGASMTGTTIASMVATRERIAIMPMVTTARATTERVAMGIEA